MYAEFRIGGIALTPDVLAKTPCYNLKVIKLAVTIDVSLFLVQHSGIHSHCLFVIHHWHWLSSVRVWRLLFCRAYETLA